MFQISNVSFDVTNLLSRFDLRVKLHNFNYSLKNPAQTIFDMFIEIHIVRHLHISQQNKRTLVYEIDDETFSYI